MMPNLFLQLPMYGKIQPHQFNEMWIVVTQHRGEIVTPILRRVNGADARTIFVRVSVDCSCDHR